jgi:GNAT superfamily N-acetyltransferase
MNIREIEKSDIADILQIRISTKENHFNMADLARIGVTHESVAEWLDGNIKGWLCEISGRSVGFAMGDGDSGEVLIIAVLPGHEQLGVGRKLMTKLQDWLWSFGHKVLWLWSNPSSGVRAHGFYRHLGWLPTGEIDGNNEMLKLYRPRSD